ncbi:MAG: ROK family protein [Phycisphaerae bacterium]
MTPLNIGVDVGGTNLKAGLVNERGGVVARLSTPTEADRGFEHVLARIVNLIDELLAAAGRSKREIGAIGIGAPGPMSHARGVVFNAPNLPGWANVPLRDRLADATGLPVSLENDANAAAFGEFVVRAAPPPQVATRSTADVAARSSAGDADHASGRGTPGAGGAAPPDSAPTATRVRDHAIHSLVMMTLGTGVGGGIVLNGRLVRGAFDNAGEIGHMIIEPQGRECPCGQRGCVERYCSANAVAERLAETVRAGEHSLLSGSILRGDEINAAQVQQAMEQGCGIAARVWDETCRYLALTCVNVQHLLNPQVVVLAGGLINAGDLLLLPVQRHFERLTWKMAPDSPRIELAKLGGDAGVIGAAALAREG